MQDESENGVSEGESTSGRRRRVLILDEAVAFGGSIVSTANLIRGLESSRYQAYFGTATDAPHVRSKLKEAADTTEVLQLRKALDYQRLSAVHGRLRKIPVPFVAKALMYLLYGIRLVVNIPYTYRVYRTIKSRGIDIVQFNNGFGNDEAAIAALLSRSAFLAFFRGYIRTSLFDRAFVVGRIRRYVAVSSASKSWAVYDGIPADRVVVATPPAIPDEVSPDRVDALRRKYGIPEGAPVVAMFGRIVRWKGQVEFVRAAHLVAQAVPDTRFLIVGDASDGRDDYESEVRAVVEEHGLGDRVIFTGYVNDVDTHYLLADLVAHTSVGAEPSGRVIFETMVNGRPIIASDRGWPKEFIEDGVDGFVVDPEDTETLADRMVRLIRDPELRATMGEKARAKVETQYGKDQYARTVMSVWDDVFEGSRQGSRG